MLSKGCCGAAGNRNRCVRQPKTYHAPGGYGVFGCRAFLSAPLPVSPLCSGLAQMTMGFAVARGVCDSPGNCPRLVATNSGDCCACPGGRTQTPKWATVFETVPYTNSSRQALVVGFSGPCDWDCGSCVGRRVTPRGILECPRLLHPSGDEGRTRGIGSRGTGGRVYRGCVSGRGPPIRRIVHSGFLLPILV